MISVSRCVRFRWPVIKLRWDPHRKWRWYISRGDSGPSLSTFAKWAISCISLFTSATVRTVAVGTKSVLVTWTRIRGTLIYICCIEMINTWVILISTLSFLCKACIIKWVIGTFWGTLASCSISSESLFTSAGIRTLVVRTISVVVTRTGFSWALVYICCNRKHSRWVISTSGFDLGENYSHRLWFCILR